MATAAIGPAVGAAGAAGLGAGAGGGIGATLSGLLELFGGGLSGAGQGIGAGLGAIGGLIGNFGGGLAGGVGGAEGGLGQFLSDPANLRAISAIGGAIGGPGSLAANLNQANQGIIQSNVGQPALNAALGVGGAQTTSPQTPQAQGAPQAAGQATTPQPGLGQLNAQDVLGNMLREALLGAIFAQPQQVAPQSVGEAISQQQGTFGQPSVLQAPTQQPPITQAQPGRGQQPPLF